MSATWSRMPLRAVAAVTAIALGAATPSVASPGAEAGAAVEGTDEPGKALDWLVGSWRADFLPHGPERAAPEMHVEWGGRRSYLRILGLQPAPDGGLIPEHETWVAWHPVRGRFELLGVYPGEGARMLETGHVELLEGGGVLLHMDVHYAEGETLPFSQRAVAGRGGHTLEFRRRLAPDGDSGLRGRFWIKRGGRWENPHPELGLDFYPWSRIATEQ